MPKLLSGLRMKLAAALLILLSLVAPRLLAAPFVPSGQPTENLTASIVTFQPGSLYWQRFGHNALLIRDTQSGRAISFNYGIFDFAAPNFFLNFARGHMTYRVVPNYLERDLLNYQAEGRWALEQRLNLDARQIGLLRDYLEWNVQPENAEYGYDYFISNCSTRVRDALDYAMAGGLKRQLVGHATTATWRSEATKLISPDALLMVVMDLALGPTADQPIDLWQQSFAPLVLMQALRGATVTDGAGRVLPLVSREVRLLPGGRANDPPDHAPDLRLQFLLAGLALAAILLGLAKFRGAATARWLLMPIAVGFSLLCGLGGVLLALLWGATEHWAGWRNESLLLVNPLSLWLAGSLLLYPRPRWRPARLTRRIAMLLVVTSSIAVLLRFLPGVAQQNLHWALLLLPVHAALAWIFWHAKPPPDEL
ncbi:DUF4105 domain-containing protein [Nevskia sp.]|uniref:lipoprotein N-acyltransferase Lnb domain-containing protein n=1 Tax=Nevskia sp. TaxID=1929292 RepID=UPI0025E016CD|nr:DUF4105 domain-containing protein [Nevskia sp.]